MYVYEKKEKLNYKPLTNVEFKVEMLDEVKHSPETEKKIFFR